MKPRSGKTGISELYQKFVAGTLPMFARHGWDKHGGLAERLGANLEPDETPFRRAMVHGRQLYVYSIWAKRNNDAAFRANADRIFAALVHQFYDPTGGGWLESVTLEGQPLSTRRVLYSHAFVLFGLSAYRYCLHEEQAGHYIDHTVGYIAQAFKNETHAYHDLLDADGSDLSNGVDQNPKMHLLEAFLFLFETSGTESVLVLARELIEFVTRSFLTQGMIIEHLGHDCEPHPATGHIVEPGHQFEWAWLLNWYARLSGDRAYQDIALTLIGNGLAVGWDKEQGGVFDQIDRHSGIVLQSTKRIWPLEELIKTASIFPEYVASQGLELPGLTEFLCTNYLDTDGRWFEQLHADLSPADTTLRASTCYHTSSALWEALKVTTPD